MTSREELEVHLDPHPLPKVRPQRSYPSLHASSATGMDDSPPVLHVLVVGFHHKKGCTVEYAYPPLTDPQAEPEWPELPSQWKNLPSLALPDGSHNFEEDTAYFHLPDLSDPRKNVFGISCFRQMDAAKLVARTEDVTRSTVQKSVCVLSRLPLYGQIQVKIKLITEAYFREGDFSKRELVRQTLDNLNACLSDDMLHTQQLYVGLSARDFVRTFKQRSLVLFKLMLLERRVLFFQSPVSDLCAAFLTLLSLHPGMLERGLGEAARTVPPDTPPCVSPCLEEPEVEEGKEAKEDAIAVNSDKEEEGDEASEADAGSVTSTVSIVDMAAERVSDIKGRLSGAIGYLSNFNGGRVAPTEEARDEPVVATTARTASPFSAHASVDAESVGLPLQIFTGGNLCHPYLSLSYLDTLSQPSITGYLIGEGGRY